jgi:hypothetical protein
MENFPFWIFLSALVFAGTFGAAHWLDSRALKAKGRNDGQAPQTP